MEKEIITTLSVSCESCLERIKMPFLTQNLKLECM